MAQKAEQLRKITTRDVGFTRTHVQEMVIAAKKPVKLYTVLGIVNGARPGSTDKGDFVKLVGDFEATNLETGEVFESQMCILPNFVGDPIGAAVHRPNSESVQFAVTIGAKPDEKSVTGYVFTSDNAMPPSAHSPLAVLKAELVEQKLLPAPAKK